MKHLFYATVFLFSCSISSLFAQTVGTCVTGKAEQFLDSNNVKARMLNTGGLFWNGDPPYYYVPKLEGTSAIFASGFWIGGYDAENKLHIAAATYGTWEFWPGPLDKDGNPPRDCTQYDRIYKVSEADIKNYEAGKA